MAKRKYQKKRPPAKLRLYWNQDKLFQEGEASLGPLHGRYLADKKALRPIQWDVTHLGDVVASGEARFAEDAKVKCERAIVNHMVLMAKKEQKHGADVQGSASAL